MFKHIVDVVTTVYDGVFWVNIAKSKLNLFYRYCLKLIGELRKEKEKKVERERRGISATLLPKFLCPNSCPSCVLCAKKKQLRRCHCQNRKINKFFFFFVIVAMALPKMKKKKFEWNYGNVIAENGRKKKILLPKSGKKF